MKVNWSTWALRSVYLVLFTYALLAIWTYFKWPGAGIVKFAPLPFVALGFLASHFTKRERLRRETLREEIRALSNDLTLRGDFTIDDFDMLYDVEELERIILMLKEMPEGQRKLQLAFDVLENESV